MQLFSKSIISPDGAMYFDVTFVDRKGVVTHRIVPLDDYVELLKKSRVEKKDTMVEVPILPKEVIRCKVSVNDPSTFEAWVVYPAKIRPLIYMSKVYTIPYPALAAHIFVKRGVRDNMYLFALAKDSLEKGDCLYRYPFGNVGTGGGCCFGNIVAKAKGPEEATNILDMFLSGNTNEDLFSKQNTEKLNQTELVKRLKGKEVFPVDLLLKSPTIYN